MIVLIDLFEQNRIPSIPYKGPAIRVGVYGQLALRQFADLDILVREPMWKATDLLLERGYKAHFVIPAKRRSAFIRLSYVRSFTRDSTTVELHWRLRRASLVHTLILQNSGSERERFRYRFMRPHSIFR
jgi:hypothetical protein